MRVLVFLFVTVVCAALQATLPPLRWLGHAPLPLMLGIPIYYALTHSRSGMLQAALLAGLLDDCIGMTPLGYSSFCYCAIGLVVERIKDIVMALQASTHALIGSLAALTCTGVTYGLLLSSGLVQWDGAWFLLKLAGSFTLGAIITPLVFRALYNLDRMMGYVRREDL